MTDDLGAWFDDLGRASVPAGDLGWVVREGRARRRRRLAARVVSLSVVALALGGSAWIVADQDGRPVPADVTKPPHLSSRLVPVVMEGPAPFPELAAEWERAQARAVTVAFHALLDRAPRRLFAYEGVRRAGDAWVVEFSDITEATALDRSIGRLIDELASKARALRAQRKQLASSADRLVQRLEEASRNVADELQQQHDVMRRNERRLRAQLADVEGQLAELEENRAQLRENARTAPVSLAMTERDRVVVVEESTLRGVAGYAESAGVVDTWGNDYFAARFDRLDRDTVRVSVRSFWTGPLSAPYQERCRPEVTDRHGDVVLLRPWPEFPPGAPEPWDDSPPTEDARDGAMISFGIRHEGRVDDLHLRMLCQWRPRQ